MVEELLTPRRYFEEFVEREKSRYSFYEKMCKISGKILKVSCPSFLKKRLDDPIYLSGLKISSDEVFSFFILSFFTSFSFFLLLSFLDFPFTLFFLIFPFFISYNILFYPQFYSEVIRIRAGNETVSIILYMVSYLSLTPVYEKAVEFTAYRCHGPIGNDFKKVIWDLKSGASSNIKEAMGKFIRKWSLWNEDFVETLIMLQLIELQSSEEERNEILKNATKKIMISTSSRMEEYALKLKTPSLFLLLFGIMLPLMGLVMFPIVSIFLVNSVNPVYIGIGYTIILPFFLWWFLYRILSKRPASYSHSEKIEEVSISEYIEIKKLKIKLPILPLAILLGFIITLPGLMYYIQLFSFYSYLFSNYPPQQAASLWQEYTMNRYEPSNMLTDTFQAMFLIWGIAFAIIFSTYFRSKEPFKLDIFIRKLEEDFQDGLFELQAALSQNLPVESAILKVMEHYERLNKKETPIAVFFLELYQKLVTPTLPFMEALFGKEGLITKIPSSLIKNIMGIVINALTKGPILASKVTENVVFYLSKLKEIEHLIKKEMSEILSNLEVQGKFITSFISGIIASSSVIIIQLLQALAKALSSIEKLYNLGTSVGESMYSTLAFLDFRKVMPPTVMELIAGIYMIEVTIITVIFLTGIARGFSKVYRDYFISRFLLVSTILFSLVFFVMVLLFQPLIIHIGRVS
ncbi:MAG: hypothetical protein QXI09_03210 [Candidatus Aenigmatarchaeota archaeon]